LMSSDTPNDSAPMKSLREVRSQSQTSIDSRLAWSSAYLLVRELENLKSLGKLEKAMDGRGLELQTLINTQISQWYRNNI
jgi:hypothetical protein